MKVTVKLLSSIALAWLIGIVMPQAAYAQAKCSGSTSADGSDPTGSGDEASNTVCGAYASAAGENNTAVGVLADASGGLDRDNNIDGGNTAVGAIANAGGAGSHNVAIGAGSYFAPFDQGVFTNASGANSNNVALGFNSHAIGDGSSNIALGSGASASGDNSSSVAISTGATANGVNSIAIGYNAQATGAYSVAVGAGSTADQDMSFAVGSSANPRTIIHVAAGVNDTDAVNMAQLRTVALSADQAQGTANTALANAATAEQTAETAQSSANQAQALANTAIDNAAIAQGSADQANDGIASVAQSLGGGASYDPATGAYTAPSYTIAGHDYATVGGALSAVDSQLTTLSGRVDGVMDLAYSIRREERRGIAAVAAMTTAPMPSEAGRTSWAVNTALFRGEVGVGGALAHRLGTDVPLAVTAGFAYAPGGNSTARVGMAGEF